MHANASAGAKVLPIARISIRKTGCVEYDSGSKRKEQRRLATTHALAQPEERGRIGKREQQRGHDH
jgi:hypothetical protein